MLPTQFSIASLSTNAMHGVEGAASSRVVDLKHNVRGSCKTHDLKSAN